MQVSAEVRWFWRNQAPVAVESWFRSGPCPPGGGKSRDDVYLRDPDQHELGIKQRGTRPGVEIKGLVALLPPVTLGTLVARVELWTKWTSTALDVRAYPSVHTRKTRWVRKLDASSPTPRELRLDENEQPLLGEPLPKLGCNVELTRVVIDGGEMWWTLGFEAFGPHETLEPSLRRAVAHMAQNPLAVSADLESSYPAWLANAVPK